MNRLCLVSALMMGSLLTVGFASAQDASQTQKVTLNDKVTIPGASLKPGDYTFSVEDRLDDRAIVRITAQDQSKHYLVLTVPSSKLPQAGNDGLVRFDISNGKDQVLRGWACPGCSSPLEFVYPKLEAAKLTDETAEPVLAVDPTYDKLPSNLSADDMKVVTLWLLSPEQIVAGNKGKGVKAEKYASAAQGANPVQTAAVPSAPAANTTPTQAAPPAAVTQAELSKPATPAPAPQQATGTSELAQDPRATTPAPATLPQATARSRAPHVRGTSIPSSTSGPMLMASSAQPHEKLPKTAGSDYLYLLSGFLLMLGALGVHLSRRFGFSR